MTEPAPAFSHATELLTARDIATVLKRTPFAIRKRMAGVAPLLNANGLQAWAFGSLPVDYQDELLFARKRSGAWTVAEAAQFARPVWEPKKPFAKLPAASQAKAYQIKEVLTVYYAVLEKDATEREARCAARQKWLEVFFPKGCSERTITNWVAKCEARGGIDHARIEAYADEKSCEHVNQRTHKRQKNRVTGELIALFKLRAVGADMNGKAAHRSIVKDWNDGKDVPGVEPKAHPHQPFPFTYKQLMRFAPSGATRKLGNKGDAAAKRDALHHIVRTYADLRPCEMYVMDDTRVNVVVHDDVSGRQIEVKCYIAMELASRKIVGYVLREGSMRADDVGALMVKVLRTSGIARRGAGYRTVFLFERGRVACSNPQQVFLESIFPDQIEIIRTSMDGMRNPGDYAQDRSGHWMGKGAIESFMRTLGLLLRDLPGQRGSVYRDTPAITGDMNQPHAGGIVDESLRTVEAARAAVFAQSLGRDTAPHALEAVQALGVRTDLLFFSQLRQHFARAIDHYNNEREHRREGFDLVAVPKSNGGQRHVTESSNDRWHKLLWRAEQRGVAPERITPPDAAMMLTHKARPVRITPQGVEITVENRPYQYWDPASLACAEAGMNTGCTKKFVALVDEADLDLIYILRADDRRFIESLPRYIKPGANDKKALGRAFRESRSTHDRARYELAQITQDHLQDRADGNTAQAAKMHGIVATTVGQHDSAEVSNLLKDMKRERNRVAQRAAEAESRHVAADSDVTAFGDTLKETA